MFFSATFAWNVWQETLLISLLTLKPKLDADSIASTYCCCNLNTFCSICEPIRSSLKRVVFLFLFFHFSVISCFNNVSTLALASAPYWSMNREREREKTKNFVLPCWYNDIMYPWNSMVLILNNISYAFLFTNVM